MLCLALLCCGLFSVHWSIQNALLSDSDSELSRWHATACWKDNHALPCAYETFFFSTFLLFDAAHGSHWLHASWTCHCGPSHSPTPHPSQQGEQPHSPRLATTCKPRSRNSTNRLAACTHLPVQADALQRSATLTCCFLNPHTAPAIVLFRIE